MSKKIILSLSVLTIIFSFGLPQSFADSNPESDFRELPSDEKEYTEPMNVLGKVIRIFDDKICVEEYCQKGDTLPVYIDGNVGLNTKNLIKLQITHCDKNYLLYCNDYVGLENMVVGEIFAENNGGGDFHAEWTIRKSVAEGLYQIEGIVDKNVIGEVGNSMMDMVNGISNGLIIIISNVEKIDATNITHITSKDATIKILEVNHGRLGGTVTYEICAKKYLKNPVFKIISDSARQNVVSEIELAEGQCHVDRYTIKAISSATISIPLATDDKNISTDELKEQIVQLEIKNLELESKIDNLQNIINEQIKVIMQMITDMKN